MHVTTLLLAGMGALLVVLALPMIGRRVPPNAFYGLRVPATFADEWVWYEANARAGRDALVVGVMLTLLPLLLPAFGASATSTLLTWCGAAVVGLLVMTIKGWRQANRLLRERRSGPGQH